MRPYQWRGVSWLHSLRSCGLSGILSDEMGLGKTIQALTSIATSRLLASIHQKFRPILVICPASVVLHWKQETQKFFQSSFFHPLLYSEWMATRRVSTTSVIADEDETFEELFHRSSGGDIIILSYAKMLREVQSLTTVVWDTVILDEAHMIKSPKSLTAQAIFRLQSQHRIALSGTPLQNHVEELWSVFNFLLPDYLGDFAKFRIEYVLPITSSIRIRRTLTKGSGTFDNKSSKDIESTRYQDKVSIALEGLTKLRKLHRQVYD